MCDKKNKLLITLFAKAGCHFRLVYKWRCTQNWKGISDHLIVAHDDKKETIPPDRTGGGRSSTFRTLMVFVSPRKNKLISLLKKLCKIFGLKIPWQYICCDVSVCHKFRMTPDKKVMGWPEIIAFILWGPWLSVCHLYNPILDQSIEPTSGQNHPPEPCRQHGQNSVFKSGLLCRWFLKTKRGLLRIRSSYIHNWHFQRVSVQQCFDAEWALRVLSLPLHDFPCLMPCLPGCLWLLCLALLIALLPHGLHCY